MFSNLRAAARAVLLIAAGFALSSCSSANRVTPQTTYQSEVHLNRSVESTAPSFATSDKRLFVNYRPGQTQSPVTFTTLPGAVCTINTPSPINAWKTFADSNGRVLYYVSIAGRNTITRETLKCSTRDLSQYFTLIYRPGASAFVPRQPVSVPSESQIDTFIKSNGFDLRTASDHVLLQHNIPPRPQDFSTNKVSASAWLEAALTPTHLVSPSTAITNIVEDTTGVTSGTWVGFADSGTHGTYNTVRANWIVPALKPIPQSPAYSSMWVGIDGSTYCASPPCSNNVIQDGTEQDFSSSNGVDHYNYYAWLDLELNNTPSTYLFGISPGDKMYGTVWKNDSGGQVYAQFYIKDLNTGQTTNVGYAAGNAFVGDSAEWIIERTLVGNELYWLPNFGSAQMTNASLVSGNTTLNYNQVLGYPLYEITMAGGQGTVGNLATTAEGGGATIDYTWVNDGCCPR
ncbi:MAG TPA: G1 family glutamic endopeptidase [Candidatus Baltobacteraceae bacterium]|nr:G1 family glutamic endopeptidase [Candidatus Baltobacteraceae bacterium]